MMWNSHWHQQHMAMWMIIAVLAALFALYFWRGRQDSNGSKNSNGSKDSPEEIVRRRYARGEIDQKTYEHMLEELRK